MMDRVHVYDCTLYMHMNDTSFSDDWFSHETLSHNGTNLPRFSLCAFVYE